MARKRMVSPAFFKHADLYDAEIVTGLPLRLAYEALWCQCDRRGYFAWKPRELKTDCLPYDPCDFADVLDALEKYGFVVAYVVAGKRYGRIPSFLDHQSFHKDEKPDRTIPEPPPDGAEPAAPPPEHRANTVQAPPKPVVSTPIAVTIAVTDTVTTKCDPPAADSPQGSRRRPTRQRPPDAAPKYPDFPHEARQEAFAYWQEKIGTVDFGRLVAAIGPLWNPDKADACRMAVRDYCGLVMRGRSAPFVSPADLAKKLGALIGNAEQNRLDAATRVERAEVIIHGVRAA